MVDAQDVHKYFHGNEVLKGINMQVAKGEVVVLIGASGSGKTTFLRCINHLEKIDAGRLWVDGRLVGYRQVGDRLYELHDRQICRDRAEIGMVFQSFNLFGHMTALENVVEAPVHVKGVPRDEARRRGKELLGLDHGAAHREAGRSEKTLRRSRWSGVSRMLRAEPFPKWRSR